MPEPPSNMERHLPGADAMRATDRFGMRKPVSDQPYSSNAGAGVSQPNTRDFGTAGSSDTTTEPGKMQAHRDDNTFSGGISTVSPNPSYAEQQRNGDGRMVHGLASELPKEQVYIAGGQHHVSNIRSAPDNGNGNGMAGSVNPDGFYGSKERSVAMQENYVPEWEHVANGRSDARANGTSPWSGAGTFGLSRLHKPSFLTNLNVNRNNNNSGPPKKFPDHSKHFFQRPKLSRRTMIILAVIMLAVVALVVGLAAGLTAGHSTAAPKVDESASYSGWITTYAASLGACGITNTGTEYVVAIGHARFDASMVDGNPNNNPLCGKMLSVEYNGKTIQVKVVDRCVACGEDDLDLALTPFEALTGADTGKFSPVTWSGI